jgi:hypothetical protein
MSEVFNFITSVLASIVAYFICIVHHFCFAKAGFTRRPVLGGE